MSLKNRIIFVVTVIIIVTITKTCKEYKNRKNNTTDIVDDRFTHLNIFYIQESDTNLSLLNSDFKSNLVRYTGLHDGVDPYKYVGNFKNSKRDSIWKVYCTIEHDSSFPTDWLIAKVHYKNGEKLKEELLFLRKTFIIKYINKDTFYGFSEDILTKKARNKRHYFINW